MFDVRKHQLELNEDNTFKIILDNDKTYIQFDGDDEWFNFSYSIGNMPGVVDLLEANRIECEFV